ncbi:hypothetical protein GCM10027299_13010 [Larkinella ripae]
MFQLTHAGYLVSLATNGRDAINLIRSESPDLLLLDLLMPYFSGLEVLEKLKESSRYFPTILMSSADLPIAHQVILEASPTNYLVKPFVLKDLLAKIEKLFSMAEV